MEQNQSSLLQPQQPEQKLAPVLSQPTQVSPTYGGFVFRVAAYIIDTFLVTIIFLLLGVILGSLDLVNLGGLVYFLLYAPLGTGLYGTTLGKKLFNLRVIKTDGGPPTIGTGYLRDALGKIISIIPFSLGLIWAAFDNKKQGWHDKIANTFVVQTAPVGGGMKFLAYFIGFFLPTLFIIGLIGTALLVAINPYEQIRKARELKEIQQQEIQQEQAPQFFP